MFSPSQAKWQAQQCLDTHQPHHAVRLLQQVLSDSPNDAEAFCLLSRAWQDLGSHRHAQQAAEQAVALDPSYAGAHLALGQAVLTNGGFRPNKNHPSAEALGDVAKSFKSVRLQWAAHHFDQALALMPELPELHVLMARLHAEESHWPQVDLHLEQALSLGPDLADVHQARIETTLLKTPAPDAETCEQLLVWADQALALAPQDPESHTAKAKALLVQAPPQIDLALAQATEAARLAPLDNNAIDTLLECHHRKHPIYGLVSRLDQKVRGTTKRVRSLPRRQLALVLLAITGLPMLLFGGVGLLLDWPNAIALGLASGFLLVLAVLALVPLTRSMATLALFQDPTVRPAITPQNAMSAALLAFSMVYIGAASLLWWTLTQAESEKVVLVSAACFAPAMAAWFCAKPGNDRHQMTLANVSLLVMWLGASWFSIASVWLLAPTVHLLPMSFAVGMAAWVANRPEV